MSEEVLSLSDFLSYDDAYFEAYSQQLADKIADENHVPHVHINSSRDFTLGTEYGYVIGRLSADGVFVGDVHYDNLNQLRLYANSTGASIEVGSSSIEDDVETYAHVIMTIEDSLYDE